MKRKVLFVASLFLATATFAQDGLTSKKGEAFLPEEGDWAIGFDGQDFINFVGNMANGTEDQYLTLNNDYNTFYGKYFKDANTAYRGSLRIGFGGSSSESHQDQNTVNTPYVDTYSSSNGLTFIVGAGLEKRRGNGRLQGVYGAQLLFGMISGTNSSTDYGRALSSTNTNGGNSRRLEYNRGNTMTLGLEGFAGVEYFILPKFSLGAEITWGFAYANTGENEDVSEFWGVKHSDPAGTAAYVVEETTITNGARSSFSLDNSAGANFKILFHF